MGDAYDVVVIGAGTGGYSAALRAAQLGKRVALVEKDQRLGGTCLLRGCIPTKALLRSAEVLDTVERASEWGIKAAGEADWSAIRAFKDSMVDKNVKGLTGLVKARGVQVLQAEASLLPGPKVSLGNASLDAADVVIASGSRPNLLPGVQLSPHVITSDQALAAEHIPESAVVIGAGAVGLEFASLYRSLGAEVTVLEALPRIAPLEDEEISKELARAYRKRGITTAAGASVQAIAETGSSARVTYLDDKGAEARVEAEVCLIAVGRGPVADGLGLAEAGVAQNARGYVEVDDQLRTSAPHVWAIGDVASTPLQLAHVSFDEGYAVAERIAGHDVAPINYANVPKVTYCTPEVASVGLTEAQARESGYEIEVAKVDLRGIGKANIVGDGGIVKVVAESGGGPVLGVHMVGPHVTDLVSEAMLITSWEASALEASAIHHPHPTLSEGIGEALLKLAGRPLHSP